MWVRNISHNRVPMILTTSYWQALRPKREIILYINPSSVQWSLPRRESVSKTAAGAIRNVWPNRYRGTIYDEGSLSFTLQTGNLMPGAGIDPSIFGARTVDDERYAPTYGGDIDNNNAPTFKRKANQRRQMDNVRATALAAAPPVPPGLRNLYDFLEMLNQPMIFGGGENRHIIIYHSRIFPTIRLEGYFTGDAISFPDDASSGNKTQWTATFQIYKSYPRWWDATSLSSSYSSALVNMGALSEIFGEVIPPQPQADKEEKPADTSVLYKQLQTVDTGAKSGGTVMQSGTPKTADTPSASAAKTPDQVLGERLSTIINELSEYVGSSKPYEFVPFTQTEFFKTMLIEVHKEASAKSPPPTPAELQKMIQKYVTFNLTDASSPMFDAYPLVIEYYANLGKSTTETSNKAFDESPDGL
jgi:hypothetical protein